MKYLCSLILFLALSITAKAAHITGGEMFYDFLGVTANGNLRYNVTLRLFRDNNCFSCADMPNSVSIGVYNNDNGTLITGYRVVARTGFQTLTPSGFPNCITNPPNLVYSLGTYTFVVEVAPNTSGYTPVFQTCCRIDGIMNVPNSVGATFATTLPGSIHLPAGETDSSPRFSSNISIVCHNNAFTLDFSATDPDPGDSIVYSFCSGFNGGAAQDASFATPSKPPYSTIFYTNGFRGDRPLGGLASIDPRTGIISGIAPNAGRYVVVVCADSYRNGQLIGTQRKDFIITVAPCDYASAELDLEYSFCNDLRVSLSNNNNSPLNETFYWDFGVPGIDTDTSTQEFPTFQYPDTGTYTVKLVINRNQACSDSTTAVVKVYPVFRSEFTSNAPMCKGIPVAFRDQSFATYGTTNSWRWDFGVTVSTTDTSTLKNPSFTYNTPGTYSATLISESTKGCRDTVSHEILIVEEPVFSLGNDTLICIIDTLRLNAVSPSAGTIQWTPNYNINNQTSFTPLVSPDITTTYIATFRDNFGCTAIDSITVRVVNEVTMNLIADTTICTGDTISLPLTSDALRFEWTPESAVNDPTVMNPLTSPVIATNYRVTGYIGNCSATRNISVRPVPYPQARVSADTSICFGSNATLRAEGGSIYSWRPVVYLDNPQGPIVNVTLPQNDVTYIVSVYDTLGCPKPDLDTVKVEVLRVIADAGPRDTSVVIGQPLLLDATGGTVYSWTPSTYLSNSLIANPVSLPQDDIDYTLRVENSSGCFDTDTISVKLYLLEPGFYVPSAFTPDGDGNNDRFRPIALGLKSMEAFRVYNRWGQLVYSSRNLSDEGWDGKIKGALQESGTYVWYAEGVTYLNQKIEGKGSVILIR